MAPSTILRSIAFSRATASAICKSSSLLALTVAISVSLRWRVRRLSSGVALSIGFGVPAGGDAVGRLVAVFVPPQRFGNERVGENESRLAHVVDPQQRLERSGVALGLDAKPRAVAFRADELAAKAFAAVD